MFVILLCGNLQSKTMIQQRFFGVVIAPILSQEMAGPTCPAADPSPAPSSSFNDLIGSRSNEPEGNGLGDKTGWSIMVYFGGSMAVNIGQLINFDHLLIYFYQTYNA